MTALSSVHNSKECYPILQQPTPTHWKKNLQVNFLYCLNHSLLLIYQDENRVRRAFPTCKHLYLNKKHNQKSEKSWWNKNCSYIFLNFRKVVLIAKHVIVFKHVTIPIYKFTFIWSHGNKTG